MLYDNIDDQNFKMAIDDNQEAMDALDKKIENVSNVERFMYQMGEHDLIIFRFLKRHHFLSFRHGKG
jgi:hypothetical protein